LVGRRLDPDSAKLRWVQAELDGCQAGGGFQGDLVAQGLELADVVAFGALGVDVDVVEAGA